MRHWLCSALLSSLIMAGGSSMAAAQTLTGAGLNRPAVSPYLNVIRSGAPYGLNYYNIVQPQVALESEISQLQFQANQLTSQRGITGLQTGHAATFVNYSHFFGGSRGRAGMGGGQLGTAGTQGGFGTPSSMQQSQMPQTPGQSYIGPMR